MPQVAMAHQRRRWFLLVSRNSHPHEVGGNLFAGTDKPDDEAIV
jgi:hypothetical protein